MEFILGGSKTPVPDDESLEFLPGADKECFLCQAVADPENRTRHVVSQGTHSIAVLNLYPYNNGHVLVAPRRHVARLDQLSAEEHLEIMQEVTRLIGYLERLLSAEGFNLGLNLGRVAGAGLPAHVHWHVVPRWNGDTNFMSVLASTDVIPQSLDALWEQLTGAIRQDE